MKDEQYKGYKICIIGGNPSYTSMFSSLGTVLEVRTSADIIDSEDEFNDVDLFVLTGGTDVDPSWYGAKKHPTTHSSVLEGREKNEMALYYHFMANDYPFVGICRGAQFLAALNGFRLYQDVKGHTQDHLVNTSCGSSFMVTSTHHQMIDVKSFHDPSQYEVLAWANVSSEVQSMPDLDSEDTKPIKHFLTQDPEVVLLPSTHTLCIQGHPEFQTAGEPFNKYSLRLCEDLIEAARQYRSTKK